MLVSEKELAVEITEIDCIEIDNVDFPEASENQVLEQLAADSTSAHHEHARLFGFG